MTLLSGGWEIAHRLEEAGHQAYIVGGAVRDYLLDREIKDVDITTSAKHDKIIDLFAGAKVVSALFHDVVLVPLRGTTYEVATMRKHAKYHDKRRPDQIVYTDDIEEDLARRDFTINAMAIGRDNVIDPHNGFADLARGALRAVGDPVERLEEHPIRAMRAARFAGTLTTRDGCKFTMESSLWIAVRDTGTKLLIEHGPWEGIRDELFKGLASDSPVDYMVELYISGLLDVVLPELRPLIGCLQNKHHFYEDVWAHTLAALAHSENDPLVRLAVLLHDVGKPATAEYVDENYGYSFIGHEKEGAAIAQEACSRLRLSNDEAELVTTSVRLHMLAAHTPKQARKFLARCGSEEAALFVLKVITADAASRTSMDVKRRAAHTNILVLNAIAEEAVVTVKDLVVNGHDVMGWTELEPGPRVGEILKMLLEAVIEDPNLNERGTLYDMVIKEVTADAKS